MFGAFRTILALLVMTYHLLIEIPYLGTYAVYGFYTLSGYLMTHIMHESYGYDFNGKKAFALNRFLRLYPTYWFAAILTVIILITIGEDFTRQYRDTIFIDHSLDSTLYNIFMVFPAWEPNQINPRLVPPSWALTVELFFYTLICLGISKNIKRTLIWFLLSNLYVVYTILDGQLWESRYFSFAAASLPFSIGSLIYFLSKQKKLTGYFRNKNIRTDIFLALILINLTFWSYLFTQTSGRALEIGFYINLLLCAVTIFLISIGKEIFNINKKIDKFIGNFSYPIYLLHIQAGLISSYILFDSVVRVQITKEGIIAYLIAIILVVILSLFIEKAIDHPINKIRNRVRQKF